MRGRSRCRGEERRGAAGAVWRGRDGGAFYRAGETVDQAAARGELSRRRLLEGETMGQ
jgi:hypothetical protein